MIFRGHCAREGFARIGFGECRGVMLPAHTSLLQTSDMKIDIHGHFVDPHYLDELQHRVMALEIEKTADGKTLMRHNGYTLAWTRPDMFDMDHRLRDMDQKGIDMRVLTVSTPGVYPWRGDAQVRITRHVNDMLAKDCRAHPDPVHRLRQPAAARRGSLVEGDRPRGRASSA